MNTTDKPGTQEALRKLIAARAYELWENQGRTHSHDRIHWHQAEQEIMSCVTENPVADNRRR